MRYDITDAQTLALHRSLDVINENAKEILLDYLEKKCGVDVYGNVGQLSREQVEYGLQLVIGDFANYFMKKYDVNLRTYREIEQ